MTRGIKTIAIIVCLFLPLTQYFLNVFTSFKKVRFTQKKAAQRAEKPFKFCGRSIDLDNYKCLKAWHLDFFIYRQSICVFISFILMCVALFTLGHLVLDTQEPTKHSLSESTTYSICAVDFDFGIDTLGPAEMTLLASLSYLEDQFINESLAYFLGSENFEFVNLSESLPESGASFYHIKAVKETQPAVVNKNPVIENFVVIRGTATFEDAMQDMKLWSETSSLQIINVFIPLLVFWPISLTSYLVWVLSSLEGWIGGRVAMNDYLDQIFDYVDDMLPAWQTYVNNTMGTNISVKMIGHSLGGGLANLVASKEYGQYMDYDVLPRVTSFGVAPVGTTYSSRKFGFPWQAVSATETSVYAKRDIVPLVDSHTGLTDVIPCNEETIVECHSVLFTLCELWRQCLLPKNALRQKQKANFLNCMCCSGYDADFCSSNIIGGTVWSRSCVIIGNLNDEVWE